MAGRWGRRVRQAAVPDATGTHVMDEKTNRLFRAIIDSAMYLSKVTRHDIVYAVN